MGLPEVLLYALSTSVFTTAGLVALGYLARRIIERWFSRDIEKYKATLQARHDKELEVLKKELYAELFEHETRFAETHATRAEIIPEVYRRTIAAIRGVDELTDRTLFELGAIETGELPLDRSLLERTASEIRALDTFFEDHRIYFNDVVSREVTALCSSCTEVMTAIAVGEIEDPIKKAKTKDPKSVLYSCIYIVHRIIPIHRQHIESELRRILG